MYPVNYPATTDFPTAIDGITDAGHHVESMAANCPRTKMVLGGYSQGAAVMGFVTSAAVPDGIDPNTVPKPLAPDVASHVSSVVLFGMPNVRAMNFLGEPPVVIGPLYQDKTVKVCAIEDPVCSDGMNFAAHDTSHVCDDAGLVWKGGHPFREGDVGLLAVFVPLAVVIGARDRIAKINRPLPQAVLTP